MFVNKYQHQIKWKTRADNSLIYKNPSQQQINNIYQFCHNYNHLYLPQFVQVTMKLHENKNYRFNNNFQIIDDITSDQNNFTIIIQNLKKQKQIFIDLISQTKFSYKGYISWILIATQNNTYLIDSAKFHDKCYQLKQVLEKKQIIKFMHNSQEILSALKRDFGIFICNIFDLQIIQRYLNKKTKSKIEPKQNLKTFINNQSVSLISNRPIKSSLLIHIRQFYKLQMQLILNLDNFFTNQDTQYQCYAYFNHYQFLLKQFYHYVPTIKEMDQLLKIKNINAKKQLKQEQRQKNKSNYLKFNEFKNINQNFYYWIKNVQEEQIAERILEWRQHMAKMKDISSEEIINYQTLSILSKSNVNSILQISQIYSKQSIFSSNQFIYFPQGSIKNRGYALSQLQIQQIFQLFQLYKQTKQQQKYSYQIQIPKRLPYYKNSQEKPIRQLFKTINFNQTNINNDWLNKKNDQAIKFYKEIVSINQFDNSIIEEYLLKNSNNFNGQNGIGMKMENFHKYIKYGEFLRNGNHKRLHQLYEKQKKKNAENDEENNKNDSDKQNWMDSDQENYNKKAWQQWQQIQNKLNFPTNNYIGSKKFGISLALINSNEHLNDISNCKTIITNYSSIKLKQNNPISFNSLYDFQSPNYFQKIQPLPQNIQMVYIQAAKAKKVFNKAPKKKASKKQTKLNNQKKQQDFVPKKQQIFDLINY